MTIDEGTAISIAVQIGAIAFFFGTMRASISSLRELLNQFKETMASDFDRLEGKQDKHNGLIERMVKVEESTKSAHHRIDETQKDKAC